MEQVACSTQRLEELERWTDSLQTAHPLALARLPQVPRFDIFRTAAWRSAPADALSRLPLEERKNYAMLYDGVNFLEAQTQTAIGYWAEIRKLSRFSPPSNAQRIDIAEDIDRIRSSYTYLKNGYTVYSPRLTKPLGVTAAEQSVSSDFLAAKAAQCKPLLAS